MDARRTSDEGVSYLVVMNDRRVSPTQQPLKRNKEELFDNIERDNEVKNRKRKSITEKKRVWTSREVRVELWTAISKANETREQV